MRHGYTHRKLGRTSSHRTAMFANMAASLIKHEQIVTTLPKAKELRPFVEKLVTLAKRGDLHARRRVLAVIGDKSVVHELFTEIAPLVAEREGGYTRITKLGYRKGDNAPMAQIELVLEPVTPKAKPAKSSKAAAPKAAPVEETPAEETTEDTTAAEAEVVEESTGDAEVSADETTAEAEAEKA